MTVREQFARHQRSKRRHRLPRDITWLATRNTCKRVSIIPLSRANHMTSHGHHTASQLAIFQFHQNNNNDRKEIQSTVVYGYLQRLVPVIIPFLIKTSQKKGEPFSSTSPAGWNHRWGRFVLYFRLIGPNLTRRPRTEGGETKTRQEGFGWNMIQWSPDAF